MEYKKGFRAVRATKRSRILLSIGLVASFAIIIFMILQTKNATEVNAAETKEQLNGMLTNLDEMNTTIQRSRETIRDSAKHMSSTSNINHETTNLETLQTDIYETQNEITNLLTEMDEGKVSDVDEKVSVIGQDLNEISLAYSTSVDEFKTIWTGMSARDKAKYEEVLTALEDVRSKAEAQSYLLMEQNKTNETLDRMQEQSNASFEQMQKQTSDSLEKMQDRTNDSLSQIQEQNKTGLQELSDKLEVLESAQSDESRLSSQRDELLHQKIDEIMTHERQTDEDIQSVFRSVSSGKCTLATALLTNGFTVADLDTDEIEEKAPLVAFSVYASSITNGLNVIREKMREYLDTNDKVDTIHEITDGIDKIADTKHAEGYTEGRDAGYTAGREDGYDAGKTEGYELGKGDGYDLGKTDGYNLGRDAGYTDGHTDGFAAGVANIKATGTGTVTATNNFYYTATDSPDSSGITVFENIYLQNTSGKNELIMLDPAYIIGNTGTIRITNGVQFTDLKRDPYEPLGILYPGGVLTCRVMKNSLGSHLLVYEISIN